MNKYLIEILKVQSSVILPGLGALMVPSQKSGKVVFNRHLKFNDGSLARFISEKENIDAQEAQNKVAKFVREIEAELGKGNSYDMFEFGRFYKNKDGEIDFDMEGEGEEQIKSTETKPTEEKKKIEKKPIVTPADILSEKKAEEKAKKEKKEKSKKEKKKAPESSDTPSDSDTEPTQKEGKQSKNTFTPSEEDIKQPSKSEEKTTDKKEDKQPPVVTSTDSGTSASDKQSKNTFTPSVKEEAAEKIKAGAVAAAGGAGHKTAAPEASNDQKKTTEKAKEKSTVKKKTTVKKEEKKKRSKLPWIILLLLLIGLAVAGYFFRHEIMAFFEKDKTETVNDDHNNGDSHPTTQDEGTVDHDTSNDLTAPDSLNAEDTQADNTAETGENEMISEEEEPVENEVEETTPVVSGSNSGNYHLIGNSFSEQSNADRYVKEMQDKGYPAKIVGRFDGLYLVSLKSYNSRSAAKDGRSTVTADASSAWIFKYPK